MTQQTKTTNNFLFDVDGTLTPSRGKIDANFEEWFLDFCRRNRVYLVTGSDYNKTIEQLGIDLCLSVERVYNCSGNEVWTKGHRIFQNDWRMGIEVERWLLEHLKASKFPLRTGTHIEIRTGTVNFSIVGRGATLGERLMYRKWDIETGERAQIAQEFNLRFPELHAQIGGETGLDIFPRGCDKSQVLNDFKKESKIFFFGDRTEPGGNDHSIASAVEKLQNGRTFSVKDWRDTFETLQYLVEAKIAE
jgi:phosphomannomutase